MIYYQCSTEALNLEIRRRGYIFIGCRDQLSEALQTDDNVRGSDATTVTTEVSGPFVPRELNSSRTAEFGKTAMVNSLVGEKIVYWSMNTFFPVLQLFFESGRSCIIDGGRLSSAEIGLDPALRFRLTECTYEEDGRIVKSIRPERFAHTGGGIRILEAIIAQRKSIAVRSQASGTGVYTPLLTGSTIVHEIHTVVGLKLDGMRDVAYVWAKSSNSSATGEKHWGDVRPAGPRDDIPAPCLGFPMHLIKPGCEVPVFSKECQVSIGRY
ncbi:hypothetical protein HBH56_168660 [Parastagonospora nodorum]|nr:hypothetical protein HBH56_168660 [Parastagonospora nodorum]QRC98711.1 hypothetical protein JI435_047520 [Parastagonospora nodorum SN15]KAH3936077.1 hypothetical protein HBH54_031750 [Parastagonospora nodorum]KAH4056835.1 hypothetical protein HBH49_037900 [Parastagonospora nodorum]KAH4144792.1 hypothetical protein HBH45_022240 [Parastagonospora nodorum]